jgi:hypothetical protein
MSWRIAADVRELLVDVEAYSPESKLFYIIRTLNRKDQLFTGVAEAINMLPPEVKTSDSSRIWITSDFERVSVREKWGSGCAFVTTEGFEDLLQIDDGKRIGLFTLQAERQAPLIPHEHCFGLNERTLATGAIEKKPESEEISNLIAKLNLAEIKSVALCFLHSPTNSENEKYVAEILKKEGLTVFSSFEEEGNERIRAKKVCEKAFSHLGSLEFKESLETIFKPENIFIKEKRPSLTEPVPQNTLHIEFLEDRWLCAHWRSNRNGTWPGGLGKRNKDLHI